MGIIEAWNKQAKKNIYINEKFELGVGRLMFSFLMLMAEFVQAYAITGNPMVFFALFGTLIVGIKKKDKSE